MIDRRTFTSRSLGLTAAAIAGPTLSANALAAEFTMRVSHQFPPAHQTSRNLEQFAKDVKDATKGRVDVQLFGAAQLFKPNQNHPAVASGKIEAASILSFQWGGTIPEMSVTIIPYLHHLGRAPEGVPASDAARQLEAKMAARA